MRQRERLHAETREDADVEEHVEFRKVWIKA